MHFYKKFVTFCNQAEKSPSRVAMEIGLSKSTVNNWKNGGMPSDSTLQKIADYFGIPVEQLEDHTDGKNPLADLINSEGDPVKDEMYHIMSTATEEELRDMLELMRFVRRKRREG